MLHGRGVCVIVSVMHNAQLLSAKEKAAELGISRSTLTRRVRAGVIVPAWRDDSSVNGVMLFHPEGDLEAVAS